MNSNQVRSYVSVFWEPEKQTFLPPVLSSTENKLQVKTNELPSQFTAGNIRYTHTVRHQIGDQNSDRPLGLAV